MSDIDPTPDTPVTIPDRMQWWRADMAARLTTLEQRVAALAGGAEVPGTLTAIVEAIEGARGISDHNTLAALWVKLNLIEATLDSNLPNVISRLVSIELATEQAAANIGISTGGAEGTVIGLLQSIRRLLLTQTAGLPPVGAVGDFTSTGAEIDGDRKCASWASAPAGTRLLEGNITLYPVSTFAGWQLYIQTTDPLPEINGNPTAPNSWVQLGAGLSSLTVCVAWQYPVQVTLRPPDGAGIILSSQVVTRLWNGTTFHAIAWPSGYGADDQLLPDRQMSANIYLPVGAGQEFAPVSGTEVQIERTILTGGTADVSYIAVDGLVSVPSTYEWLVVFSTVGPFSVRWTTP